MKRSVSILVLFTIALFMLPASVSAFEFEAKESSVGMSGGGEKQLVFTVRNTDTEAIAVIFSVENKMNLEEAGFTVIVPSKIKVTGTNDTSHLPSKDVSLAIKAPNEDMDTQLIFVATIEYTTDSESSIIDIMVMKSASFVPVGIMPLFAGIAMALCLKRKTNGD